MAGIFRKPYWNYYVPPKPNAAIATLSFPPSQTLSLPTIASGATLNTPSVIYVVELPTITTGATVTEPTVAYQINMPTITSGATLYDLVVEGGLLVLEPPFLSSEVDLFPPSLGTHIDETPYLDSGAIVYAPAAVGNEQAITMPFLDDSPSGGSGGSGTFSATYINMGLGQGIS